MIIVKIIFILFLFDFIRQAFTGKSLMLKALKAKDKRKYKQLATKLKLLELEEAKSNKLKSSISNLDEF